MKSIKILKQLLRTSCWLLLFCALAGNLRAQQLDSLGLDTMRTYRSLEQALRHPEKVYKLSLIKQKYSEVPPEIFQFKNLHVLDLSRNRIKQVPAEIADLKHLVKVSFSKNRMVDFPAALCNLPALKDLNLNQNFIEAIPPEIKLLRNLERLDMWSNELSEFPAELRYLYKLKWVDFRVILMSSNTQKRIQGYLPEAKIYFSAPCNGCAF